MLIKKYLLPFDWLGMVNTLDHDDHVGLGQGDVHSVPHLQLARVAPVRQVVAVRHAGRTKYILYYKK